MTDVSKTALTRVATYADARAFYHANPADNANRIGLEAEMHLYTMEGGLPRMASVDALAAVQGKLIAEGHNAQLEAAGVLEYASPAYELKDIAALYREAKAGVTRFEAAAKEAGLTRAPLAVLPSATMAEALAKMNGRERLQTGINALVKTAPADAAKVALLTAGVQVSFSPPDMDAFHRMAYRAYALTPLIYAALDSGAAFAEENEARQEKHLRGAYYEGYGRAGGIDEAFLKSDDAAGYVDAHIEAVFDTPMYFAYGAEGELIPATRQAPLTFRALIAKGLNTRANYELAESFLYHDVKLCNLRDGDGTTIGKRLEVRAADSGPHQAESLLALTATLIPDGAGADAFMGLLKRYGFSGSPRADAALLRKSRENAVHHGGAFLDVAFGTGRLRDFAQEVKTILEAHGEMPLGRLGEILESGVSDAALLKAGAPRYHDVVRRLERLAL